MNSSNLFRRMMSMVLCIIMALSLVAMPISADENTGLEELFEEVIPVATAASGGETIYVIAGSDFQNAPNTGVGDTKTDEALEKTSYNDFKDTPRVVVTEKIMTEIKSNGIENPYGILFCGDYTGSTSTTVNQNGVALARYAKSGITQLETLTKHVFGDNTIKDWVFVQGNHDTEIDDADGLSVAGANDTDYYGVYVLHDEDYGWKQGWHTLADKTQRAHADVKAIEKSATNMRNYFEAKLSDKNWNNKPIFIAAHIPLHYSSRTKYDQDARYAEKIFEVINEYGAKGLNIIYLFGHNHSQPYDTYLGGSAIYLSRGDSIFIADPENYADVPNQYMLNFTYMNAGYMSTSEAINEDGEVCSMAVFAITGSQVEIKRYSHDGMLDLKLPGVVEEEIDRMLAEEAQAEIEITYTVKPSGGSDMEITENRKTYGMAAEEWQSYVGERITTAVINPIANTGTGTQVAIPKYTIRFYQTDTFIDGRSYVIANYGDATCKWTDGHYALRLKEDGNIGRSTITIKKDENGRYYVTPWDGAERYSARERTRSTQWVWKSTGQNATYTESSEQIGKLVASVPMGNLQALTTGQYLRVFGNNDDKLNLGTHTDPTTENPNPTVYGLGVSDTLADSNRALWGFDTSKRHKDGSGYKYEGKNFGLFVLTNAAGDKLRNDGYYITRNSATDTTWGIRLYKHADNTSQGPTYIFERDNTIPDGSDTYLVTGVDSQMHLVTGQYGSWERLKMDLLTKLSVKKNGKQYTDFTVTSDFVPNEAGEYIVYITCDGQTIGTICLYVQQASLQTLKSTTLVPAYGYVFQNAAGTVATDASLRLTFTEGAQIDVPITVDMLTDANGNKVSTATLGTLENLTVTYNSLKAEGFTLYVVDQNMPVYPNPGSTKVDKVGTGVDFQNTGAAQIELSATGVPLVEGFDVIVMVDTSTSMAEHDGVSAAGKEEYDTNQDGNLSRIERTREAVNVLIDTLKTDVNNGTLADVQIAIAQFNGYRVVNTQAGETYEPEDYYACDTDCYDHAYASKNATTGKYDVKGLPFSEDSSVDHGAITGVDDSMDLSHRAFVDVTKLSANGLKWADETTLPMYSGTNYDFAFDAIYQLGHNIQKYNEEQGKGNRELIVIFLSDGMPFQYNYYMGDAWRHSTGYWATGVFPEKTTTQAGYNETRKDKVMPNLKDYLGDSKYGHFYNPDQNKHWMAEAIKGDPNERYPIIRKTTYGLEDALNNTLDTEGKTGKKYMGTLPGLGATLYTIGIGIHKDYNLTKATDMAAVMKKLATDEDHFQNVMPEDDLALAFTSFIGDMKQAATGAYFLDTMGEAYDLYMSNAIDQSGGGTLPSETPKIELVKYELKDGIRTGKFEILDSMTFGDNYLTTTEGTITVKGYDGQEVPGNTMGSVIKSGKYIWYNTAKSGDPESITDGKNTISLPPETFYCKLADGVLGEDFEYALRYYVYLTDALDDNEDNDAVPAGVYPTNKSATLNYINYLGNVCKKDTISPKLPWEAAQVSYAFYLVNDQGEIISDQKTGATTDKFSNRVAITRPVVFQTIDLNTSSNLTSQILAKDVLPAGYELFVKTDVDYSVTVNSGEGGGSWTIRNDNTGTTYVTGIGGDAYNNATSSENAYDYSNTTVWFAVVANIGCVPDTVVVDFGLPVNIDVMSNDLMIGTNGTLKAIGKNKPANSKPENGSNQSLEKGFATELKDGLQYGTAHIENNKVVYSLNTMEMDDAEVFYYGLQYTGNVGAQGYYYGEVTVIPATIIYYEDNFLEYEAYKMVDDTQVEASKVWKSVKNNAENQSQDRPGEFNLPDLDADNIYGYDPAYEGMHTYSMKGNHNAKVNSTYYGIAKFDFTGTGFDVLSVCYYTTGTLMVSVYEKEAFANAKGSTTAQKMQNATPVDVQMVDTYWGYEWKDGQWQPVESVDGISATYQIPVIKMELEEYDNYTAVITASYMPAFDHYGTADYLLYIDAIRIYDPANDGADNQVIEDAYVADGEGWPEYHELRNQILDTKSFGKLTGSNAKYSKGVVYIDGNTALSDGNASGARPEEGMKAAISDYYNFGPNNELYLRNKQGISFNLTDDENIASIHIAVKKLAKSSENSAKVKIFDAETEYAKAETIEINTATDLYYDITHLKGKTVVIYNLASAPISITNIKITHKSDPNGTGNASYEPFTVTKRGAAMALKSLGSSLPEIQDPQATAVQKWNIVLGDDIGANFYVEAPENGAASAVKVTVAGHTETYDLSALTPNEEGLYKISVNVAAAQMTEEITLQMVVDGTEYDPVSYSIQNYAKVILTGEYSDETKALVKHMLNYGAAAQNYFGVNKDNLANAGNEIAYTAQYPAEYPQLAVNGKISGIRFYGASLVFESKVALRYYFEADSVEGVIFTVNGVSCPAVEKNGMFYVEIPNIAPYAYGDAFVLSAQKDGQTMEVSYSPMTYMVRMSQKGQENLKALMNAMYGYYEAAIAYTEQAN